MAHPKNREAQDLPLGGVMGKEVGETEETYYEVVGNPIVHAEEDATSHTAQALASLETAEMAQIPGNKSKKIRGLYCPPIIPAELGRALQSSGGFQR